MRKKRILVFCDYYLPGFKSGGGMWTVVNLVDRFADRYDFFVVTRDHDGPNDLEPHRDIKADAWNAVGKAKVYYLKREELNQKKLTALVKETGPDAVFLNSAFSKTSRTFLEARRRSRFRRLPVIIAPCGELSPGCLSLKPLKKKIFLRYAKSVGLYDDVIWKGSFPIEGRDISAQVGNGAIVMIAPDLAPKQIIPDFDITSKPHKTQGSAKFIFVSRISRKKNIHFFLNELLNIRERKIAFEIVGPVEDDSYWQQCLSIIRRLGPNISVKYIGPLHHPDVLRRLVDSHFFVLPTLHENFGYVFVESLAAGSPILISENTAWHDIEEKGIGWIASLSDPKAWLDQIYRCVDMNDSEFRAMSLRARDYAVEWLARPDIDESNALVLEAALRDVALATANEF